VYPAAALPEIALSGGARLVIVNQQETPFDSYAAATSTAPLGELLPALVDRI
jgi:NAD-dependent deacetylase